jgi:hypothetical protein
LIRPLRSYFCNTGWRHVDRRRLGERLTESVDTRRATTEVQVRSALRHVVVARMNSASAECRRSDRKVRESP